MKDNPPLFKLFNEGWETLVNQSNNRVDEDNSLDEHQKQQIKKDNEIILRMCADITKNKLKETEQLIED